MTHVFIPPPRERAPEPSRPGGRRANGASSLGELYEHYKRNERLLTAETRASYQKPEIVFGGWPSFARAGALMVGLSLKVEVATWQVLIGHNAPPWRAYRGG